MIALAQRPGPPAGGIPDVAERGSRTARKGEDENITENFLKLALVAPGGRGAGRSRASRGNRGEASQQGSLTAWRWYSNRPS